MVELSSNEKKLMWRYLIWYYKSTKEDIDKIDRYYTQEIVDTFLLKKLKESKNFDNGKGSSVYLDCVDVFEEYRDNKKLKADEQKFFNVNEKKVCAEYQYLTDKLVAIEKAIEHFFGKKELDDIVSLYEEEMIDRILKARKHD